MDEEMMIEKPSAWPAGLLSEPSDGGHTGLLLTILTIDSN